MNETYTAKYRPKDWKDVVGQAVVVRSLKAALTDGTNHTFLFSGPSGTGKTTLARIAAKHLGCQASDINEINAAHFTGVEDMRQLGETTKFKSLSGRPRMIILDECHRLSAAAFASILKPLEEPPEGMWWVLCTTDPAKVPQTIQTRCIRYTLAAVGKDDLAEMLEGVADVEGLNLEAAIIDLCVKQAQGSPRMALVNLATCAQAKNKDEAKKLLQTVIDSTVAIDLARALTSGAEWFIVVELLEGLKDENPESIRHVVRSYLTKVIMNPKTGKGVEKHLAVLEQFSRPFPSSDGISPLVLACGNLYFGSMSN